MRVTPTSCFNSATGMNREDKKRIVFTLGQHDYINLKNRLRYDRLTQKSFFKFLIERYIEKDPVMLQLMADCKVQYSSLGAHKIRRMHKMHTQAQETLASLGITKEDKDKIYDILEEFGKDSNES